MQMKEIKSEQGCAKIGFGMFHPATRTTYEDQEGKNWFSVTVHCGCRGTKGGHDPRSGAWRFYEGKQAECKNSNKIK